MHRRTSSQEIPKCLAHAQLIESLHILLCEVCVGLGSEVHLPVVKRNWLGPTWRGIRRQVRKEDRKQRMGWWSVGMRWWWRTGRSVSVGAGWIHPSHGWLSGGRWWTRYLLCLLIVFVFVLPFIITSSVFFLVPSTFPNKRRARKWTVLLLSASPTWRCNPRANKWSTTKSGSEGLGFL
jgi:hypothetical protein